VSAALAAVKDSVKVPWTNLGTPNMNLPPVTAREQAINASNASGKVAAADLQTEVLELDMHPTATLQHVGPIHHALHTDQKGRTSVDQSHSSGNTSILEAVSSDEAEKSDVALAEGTLRSSADWASTKEIPARTLTRKHFEVALSEIRPSSSEEGSLPELRKVSLPLSYSADLLWAEQFGEGGTQRGRKKGFGKGFGFADPALKSDGDKGYGKVAQDD
jgi:hypothetical protein